MFRPDEALDALVGSPERSLAIFCTDDGEAPRGTAKPDSLSARLPAGLRPWAAELAATESIDALAEPLDQPGRALDGFDCPPDGFVGVPDGLVTDALGEPPGAYGAHVSGGSPFSCRPVLRSRSGINSVPAGQPSNASPFAHPVLISMEVFTLYPISICAPSGRVKKADCPPFLPGGSLIGAPNPKGLANTCIRAKAASQFCVDNGPATAKLYLSDA